MVHGLQVVTHADSSNVSKYGWEEIKQYLASLPNVGFYYVNSRALTERKAQIVKQGPSEGFEPLLKRGN